MAKRLAWVLLLPLFLAAPARAQAPHCSPMSLASARLEARKLLDDAEQAPDRRSRVRALEAAYRLYQDPVILYNLGMIWYASGKRVEGADLLRRYLHEAGDRVAAERRQRLEAMLGKLAGRRGQIELTSEPCSFVYVDGRLVGRLPLPLPLLLKAGRHSIEVEKDHRVKRVTANVQAELMPLQVRLPATAVVLAQSRQAEALAEAAAAAITAEGLTVITDRARQAIIRRTPPLSACLATQGCQEELARLLQAQYVVVLAGEDAMSVQLLDLEAGAVSGVAQGPACPGCTKEERAGPVTRLVAEVLKVGLQAPKGTLELTSVPEAEVVMDGRKLGRTPLMRLVLAGPHSLRLQSAGYLPHEQRVHVESGGRVAVSATLSVDTPPVPKLDLLSQVNLPQPAQAREPEPESPRAPPPRRPRWRVGTGIALIGAGGVLATLGGLALAVDGQCGPAGTPVEEMCDRVYRSRTAGGVMIGSGAALALAGVLTLAWPPKATVESQPVIPAARVAVR